MTELESQRVAIFGLGLMGGSLAMALHGKCMELIGIDPDPETLAFAAAHQIVDRTSDDAMTVLADATIIILAAPVRVNLRLLEEIPVMHLGAAKVLDLGSTKSLILQKMSLLPDRFDPIGGHPMCGKENGGIINADPSIFYGAPFALTPLSRSSDSIRRLAEQLVHEIGSKPVWLDADTHDRLVAATSHVPYLIANALAGATPAETSSLIGPGFRSTTRLAGSSIGMMSDILWTNRENILTSLERFQDRLKLVQSMLVSEDEAKLHETLCEGRESYYSLTH